MLSMEGYFQDDDEDDEPPIVCLVRRIIVKAVEMGATEIHLEPQTGYKMAVWYQMSDGSRLDCNSPPRRLYPAILARIKIMGGGANPQQNLGVISGLNIADKQNPQRGTIKTQINNKNYLLDVSTTPTEFGQTCVMKVTQGLDDICWDGLVDLSSWENS